MFEEFRSMLLDLEDTSKTNEKKDIILSHCHEHPTNKKLLKAALTDIIRYNVTSENCKKNPDLMYQVVTNDFFELLDMLSGRIVTGHEAIALVNTFVNKNKEYEDIIFRILDKDLKCGVNASLVNKVFDGLIPEFKVALANSFDDYKDKKGMDFFDGSWGCTRKLDGLRCVCIVDHGGNVTFYTRKGREFTTLDVLKEKIKGLGVTNFVLDGELCIVDSDGNEDFKEISKLYKRKDFTIPNPKYKIFDALTFEEFNQKHSSVPIIDRMDRFGFLKTLVKNYPDNFDLVEQNVISCKEDFENWINIASDSGWEGLMLRNLKATYEGKRTKNLLKVKKFHDMEFIVKDVEVGAYRVVEDGKEKEIQTMTNVIVEYKGNRLSIGSGFSLDERKRFYKNPNEIIGNEITVQYFEETEDKNGKKSLRFPTVKVIYSGKRDC